jgi:hypothetical protein
MAKKNKLVYAFNGTTEGLRDALVYHFDLLASGTTTGSNYSAGVEAGQRMAYRDIVKFLKRLIINKSLDENEEAA